MLIKSDFDINIKSIEEFAKVAIPEVLNKNINIVHQESFDDISITIEIENKRKSFQYKNLHGKIDDQKIAMIKILLLIFYNKNYTWGSLIGVRPTKIVRRLLGYNCNISEIKDILLNFYLVTMEKIDLLIDVVLTEEKLLNRDFVNIYIGIPFCPTKCTYCSFASYEINSGVGRFYSDFISTLSEEIKMVGNYLKKNNYPIESIYIGGGTPSILEESDMENILGQIREHFDFSHMKEFTLEAGREDTLNKKKLQIMKKYGVQRISLNPQTFNQKTLKLINRNFDREHFDNIYHISKDLGFIINMDLILGLPDENSQDIVHTLDEILNYDIDNLTIHSLAFKRKSNLFKGEKIRKTLNQDTINQKIKEVIARKKMKPYYLYRQKNIMDWGENVGYSKEGLESLFNIEMIEENQMTIGLGGGAISKFISIDKYSRDYIERIVNPKDPALYIKEMEIRNLEKFKKLEKIMGKN